MNGTREGRCPVWLSASTLLVLSILLVLLQLQIPSAWAGRTRAVPRLGERGSPTYDCDVLVVGGSLAGVAAAHESASAGVRTCLVSRLQMLGGQATTQAVSAFDEMFIDFGTTYAQLRQGIREAFAKQYQVDVDSHRHSFDGGINPGGCWVGRICFDPRTGAQVIESMLQPFVSTGELRIWREFVPVKALVEDSVLSGVVFAPSTNASAPVDTLVLTAAVVIDATDLGDLLPLAGAAYVTGEEAQDDTGEPDAPTSANPSCVQALTFGFYLERRPEGEQHRLPCPPGYNATLYSLAAYRGAFFNTTSAWFERTYGFPLSFWTYRRVLWAAQTPGTAAADVALINWNPGNDFNSACGPDGCNIIDQAPDAVARILDRARAHALGFAYYLQTDAPRDDAGTGYPNLLLRADVTGTADGLSVEPYIREGRRARTVARLVQQDIASPVQDPARALWYRSVRLYNDSVGIARYDLDVHGVPGCSPKPITVLPGAAQIPLGALVPVALDGLLMGGGKNLGATHLTQAMYRVHAAEWNVAQAAGAAAAWAVRTGRSPRDLLADRRLLRGLQLRLVAGRGGPVFWWRDGLAAPVQPAQDVPRTDAALFVAAQMLGVLGVVPADPMSIAFRAADGLSADEADTWLANAAHVLATGGDSAPPSPAATADRSPLAANLSRAELAASVVAAVCATSPVPAAPCPPTPFGAAAFADVPLADARRAAVEALWTWGLLDGDVAALPPQSDLGVVCFAPDAPVSRRTAAIWIWRWVQRGLGLEDVL